MLKASTWAAAAAAAAAVQKSRGYSPSFFF